MKSIIKKNKLYYAHGQNKGSHGKIKLGFPLAKSLIRKLYANRGLSVFNFAIQLLVEFKEYLLQCARTY